MVQPLVFDYKSSKTMADSGFQMNILKEMQIKTKLVCLALTGIFSFLFFLACFFFLNKKLVC